MPPSLVDRYRFMVFLRRFEEACLQGVKTGEIHGELHLGIGQEAISAGLFGALRDDDALVSTHRNHGHALAKGVEPYPLMAEIFEKSTGLCGGFGGHMHPFDLAHKFSATGIVGANLPVALGHAYAARLAGRDSVAVAVTGDGGINTGGFAESANLAGAWNLPLVIVIENNEWAISVPFAETSATATLAERAPAYGARGVRVDGLDVEAVTDAVREAITDARAGGGPVIVEAMCYRFRGHYEGDADLYRADDEKQTRLAQDPLPITRRLLLDRGSSTADLDDLEHAVSIEVEALLERVRRDPSPPATDAHDHVFLGGTT